MKRDRIAVYVSDISSREFSEEKLNLLESARRKKILTAKSAEYKKTSLFAGLLIRAALSEEGAAVSPSLPLFVRYGTFGKPYIDGQKRFSISHSGNIVAVAVADFEIGLDVEKVREIDHDGLSRRALSLGEIRDIIFLSSDKKSEKFLSFWTAKEAYFKYLGTGVNGDLREVDAELIREKGHFLKTDAFFSVGEKYVYSLASDREFTTEIKTITNL